MKYPKIETLFVRDKATFKVLPEHVRCPEFEAIHSWRITEKIDGTNVRVRWRPHDGTVWFGGRTDRAQMPTCLLDHLQRTIVPDDLAALWPSEDFKGRDDAEVWLFGEGYGERIQKGGGLYRSGVSFRLFDARVGQWWLAWDAVCDVARTLGIETAPLLAAVDCTPCGAWAPGWLEGLVRTTQPATVQGLEANASVPRHVEGVVARSDPLMLFRDGNPIMWKLKFRDFAQEDQQCDD